MMIWRKKTLKFCSISCWAKGNARKEKIARLSRRNSLTTQYTNHQDRCIPSYNIQKCASFRMMFFLHAQTAIKKPNKSTIKSTMRNLILSELCGLVAIPVMLTTPQWQSLHGYLIVKSIARRWPSHLFPVTYRSAASAGDYAWSHRGVPPPDGVAVSALR